MQIFGASFKKRENNSGYNTESWGIPSSVNRIFDFALLVCFAKVGFD